MRWEIAWSHARSPRHSTKARWPGAGYDYFAVSGALPRELKDARTLPAGAPWRRAEGGSRPRIRGDEASFCTGTDLFVDGDLSILCHICDKKKCMKTVQMGCAEPVLMGIAVSDYLPKQRLALLSGGRSPYRIAAVVHGSEHQLPEATPWLRERTRRGRGRGSVSPKKSTRLNSSHANISYAVFCLKKKNNHETRHHSAESINPPDISQTDRTHSQ